MRFVRVYFQFVFFSLLLLLLLFVSFRFRSFPYGVPVHQTHNMNITRTDSMISIHKFLEQPRKNFAYININRMHKDLHESRDSMPGPKVCPKCSAMRCNLVFFFLVLNLVYIAPRSQFNILVGKKYEGNSSSRAAALFIGIYFCAFVREPSELHACLCACVPFDVCCDLHLGRTMYAHFNSFHGSFVVNV